MHAFKEESQILWIDSWRDAVPQVRNPSFGGFASFETLAHPFHLPFDRFSAAVQHVGIQISLQSNFGSNEFASFRRFDAPVESKDVVSCIGR